MQKCVKMTLPSFGGLETIWEYIEKKSNFTQMLYSKHAFYRGTFEMIIFDRQSKKYTILFIL